MYIFSNDYILSIKDNCKYDSDIIDVLHKFAKKDNVTFIQNNLKQSIIERIKNNTNYCEIILYLRDKYDDGLYKLTKIYDNDLNEKDRKKILKISKIMQKIVKSIMNDKYDKKFYSNFFKLLLSVKDFLHSFFNLE